MFADTGIDWNAFWVVMMTESQEPVVARDGPRTSKSQCRSLIFSDDVVLARQTTGHDGNPQ
jgi:hypothetical protein